MSAGFGEAVAVAAPAGKARAGFVIRNLTAHSAAVIASTADLGRNHQCPIARTLETKNDVGWVAAATTTVGIDSSWRH